MRIIFKNILKLKKWFIRIHLLNYDDILNKESKFDVYQIF